VPIRRLTPFEYSNTIRDLLNDESRPGNGLPGEQVGNGFGNESASQSVSFGQAERYMTIAEALSAKVTAPESIATLAACAGSITAATDAATEAACARSILDAFVPRAFRRPLEGGEAEELVALFSEVRSQGSSFASSIGAVLKMVLQAPEFLYRPELGVPEPGVQRLRLSGHEMASRLSYLFWGSMPDDALLAAASAGTLNTKEGVRAEAARLLADEKSREVVRFFFDNLLPIPTLSQLARDPARYPTFSPEIGDLMRLETQSFLDYLIFSGAPDAGTWPMAFTAGYTFVSDKLAAYYGLPPVTGSAFQKVSLDTSKRAGLLGQAGVVAGPIHSNEANPVVRGSFIVQKLLCRVVPKPGKEIQDMVMLPDPYSGPTARDRYRAHSEQQVCAGCHAYMDPVGFALENYDPVGLWRDQENGVTIDASGQVEFIGAFNGPVELSRMIGESEAAQECFATHWASFAYGKIVDEADQCSMQKLQTKFKESGYRVQELLLELTQADAFLYLPAVRP
jgi:hypothetical protein